MDGQPPPAGWYPDPLEGSAYRWWDGSAWTLEVTTDVPSTVSADPMALPPEY